MPKMFPHVVTDLDPEVASDQPCPNRPESYPHFWLRTFVSSEGALDTVAWRRSEDVKAHQAAGSVEVWICQYGCGTFSGSEAHPENRQLIKQMIAATQ